MERSVLVTEAHTPLGGSLVGLLLARGFKVAAAVDPASQGAERGWPAEHRARPFLSVAWNRRSLVASHTLLRAILGSFGRLDEAIVLEPAAPAVHLASCAAVDIDRAFDDLKGVAFLVRELLGCLQAQGGLLCLAGFLPRPQESPGAALEQALREGFRGLASSLLAPGQQPSPAANCFQGGASEPADYAAFIDRILEEKGRRMTGRTFTCPPRGGARGRG